MKKAILLVSLLPQQQHCAFAGTLALSQNQAKPTGVIRRDNEGLHFQENFIVEFNQWKHCPRSKSLHFFILIFFEAGFQKGCHRVEVVLLHTLKMMLYKQNKSIPNFPSMRNKIIKDAQTSWKNFSESLPKSDMIRKIYSDISNFLKKIVIISTS